MEHLYSSSERFLLHLCTLLQQFSDRTDPAEDCLREICHAEVLFHPGSELSTVHVRRMYATKTQLHSSDSAPTMVGDAQLLDALDREKDPMLRFISIATRSGLFVLFADVRLERLIGIVRSPKSMEHILAAFDSTDATLFVHTRKVLADTAPALIHPEFDV